MFRRESMVRIAIFLSQNSINLSLSLSYFLLILETRDISTTQILSHCHVWAVESLQWFILLFNDPKSKIKKKKGDRFTITLHMLFLPWDIQWFAMFLRFLKIWTKSRAEISCLSHFQHSKEDQRLGSQLWDAQKIQKLNLRLYDFAQISQGPW